MKRAAGQIRKVRRNKGGDKESNDDGSQHEQMQQPARRKPTPEEAALTAKNYRLAKELSDLRVRHREECKAVTRLTMENMNLASRWREAIGHVAVLKKELALHQRRAAEALAQQKAHAEFQRVMTPTQTSESMVQSIHSTPSKKTSASLVDQSPSDNNNAGGTSLQDVAAEMDRMDRILAAHQAQSASKATQPPPPPPPLPKEATTPPTLAASKSHSRDSADSLSFTSDNDGEEKKTQSTDQAVTPSPEKDDDVEDDEDDDEDADEFDPQSNLGSPKENFFPMFPSATAQVDLDEVEAADQPLDLPPHSALPSESPPPSPPKETDTSTYHFNRSQDDIIQDVEEQGPNPPLFPMTASPKLMVKAKVYNEEFPADITSDVTRHPRSAERKTPPEFNDIEEEESTNVAKAPARKRPPPPPLSGIDAFEASFSTQFPDSFSPVEDTKSTSPESNTEEEYNPFFPSPSKEEEEESENNCGDTSPSKLKPSSSAELDSERLTSPSGRYGQADNSPSPVLSGRPRSANLDQFFPASRNGENANKGAGRENLKNGVATSTTRNGSPHISTGAPPQRLPSYSTESPSPSKTTSSNALRFETPPHGQRSPEPSGSDGPKRPEKAGAAAARARYEKALQPRGFAANSHRFPRRAEREVERGASPVSAPSVASSNNANDDLGKNETTDLQVNRTKLAMAQARVKERTAAYTGRAPVPAAPENGTSKSYASFRENQWTPRPSPTDSIASKPWDEEIGDSSNAKSKTPSPVNGTNGINRVNGSELNSPTAVNGSNSRINGVDSQQFPSNSPSSVKGTGRTTGTNSQFPRTSPLGNSTRGFNRQSITRDRPWDRSNQQQQQEAPSRTSHTAAIRAANYLVQQDDTTSNSSDSPTSRFIAAGKNRRRVKQPISYTEPSLNAKLRQGDVFFAKTEKEETKEMRPHISSVVHL